MTLPSEPSAPDDRIIDQWRPDDAEPQPSQPSQPEWRPRRLAPSGTTGQPGNALFEFAYLGYVRSREDRRTGAGDPDLFERLAELAEPENWDSPDGDGPSNKLILLNYVKWTFERATQDGQAAGREWIVPSEDGGLCVFDTGLVTERKEPIFGLFRRNEQPGRQDWVFVDWRVRSASDIVRHFPRRPDLVTYMEDPADFIYNVDCDLEVDIDHILGEQGNLNRFPEMLREHPDLARHALFGAVEAAKERVRRNYTAAVPMWYPPRRKVQLLLPLSLIDAKVADLALVVSREGEEAYRGYTVLTLAMAYKNARLLARLDAHWLRPAVSDGAQ